METVVEWLLGATYCSRHELPTGLRPLEMASHSRGRRERNPREHIRGRCAMEITLRSHDSLLGPVR